MNKDKRDIREFREINEIRDISEISAISDDAIGLGLCRPIGLPHRR